MALQRVDYRGGANRTGGTQRVAQRNRAAHRVDLGRVQAQRVHHRQRLRGKRLVQLEPVDVVVRQTGITQRGGNGLDRTDAHDVRRHALGGVADKTRQRFQTKLLDGLFTGQHQRACAV